MMNYYRPRHAASHKEAILEFLGLCACGLAFALLLGVGLIL